MSALTAPKRRQRRPGVRTNQATQPQASIGAEENSPPLRRAIYLRISTDELHQPFSLEAQNFKLCNYVRSRDNWELVGKPYIDEKSGAITDRPALKRALAAARPGSSTHCWSTAWTGCPDQSGACRRSSPTSKTRAWHSGPRPNLSIPTPLPGA